MTPEREKICRQTASLFALTTSSAQGEAQAAKEKVKALVKEHGLTFADVSPHCNRNEVALKVMRDFWSIPEGRPSPSPPPPAPSTRNSVRDLADIIARMSQGMGQGIYPPGETKSYDNPYGVPYGRAYDFAAEWAEWPGTKFRETPPLSVVWEGRTVAVADLADYALKRLIIEHETRQDRLAGMRGRAHDFLDDGDYAGAISLLQFMQAMPAALGPEVYQGLLKERDERPLRVHRPKPGRWG